MKNTEEIVEETKPFKEVEYGGSTFFCTEDPWFDRFDDAYYWWKANAVDTEGEEYLITWAFDDDPVDISLLPWDDVYGVERI